MSTSYGRIFLNILISIAILTAGIGFMLHMVKNRKIPEQKEIVNTGVLVETMTAEKIKHTIKIELTGTINVFEKAQITPEVSGIVVKINKNLEKGGYIKKGEVLFEIDSFNYKTILEQTKSGLALAQSDFEKIESESKSAKNEWETFNPQKEPPNKLIYLIPQVKAARATLNAKKAEYEKALKDLGRTKVYSPFNAVVLDENISMGVFLSPSKTALTLIPSDKRDVIIPVPVEKLNLLTNNKGEFINKKIDITIAGTKFSFKGEILRLLPDVDEKTKMYQILARISNIHKRYGEKSNLLSDKTFVSTIIYGQTIENSYIIPSKALRGSSKIWLFNEKHKLIIKDIELISHENNKAIIKSEIKDGSKIIITPVNGAVNNMLLREKEGV